MKDAKHAIVQSKVKFTQIYTFLYHAVEILLQVRHEHVAIVYDTRDIAGFATVLYKSLGMCAI